MILLSNVTVLDRLSSRPILDAFELRLDKGELRVLVGAGASGKTTIIQLIAGERTPNSGEVRVNDLSVPALRGRELARYRRRLGIVVQEGPLIAHRTVAEHIALPLEVDGMSAERRKEQVDAVLERFGLVDARQKQPEELSRSESQRVAIAVAVTREPFLLLADEPAAHLDAISAKEIAKLLLHENLRGMTVLIATSDERFAGFFPELCVVTMENNVLV